MREEMPQLKCKPWTEESLSNSIEGAELVVKQAVLLPTEENFSALKEVLDKKRSLRGIHFLECHLENDAEFIRILLVGLNRYPHIHALHFSYLQWNFASSHWVRLTAGLSSNASLGTLEISFSKLRSEHMLIMSEGLKQNRNARLRSLNLSGNPLMGSVADLLKATPTLTDLVLRDSRIDAEGAISLAKALNEQKGDLSLDISYLQLGKNGVSIPFASSEDMCVFMTLVGSCRNLTFIDLSNIRGLTFLSLSQFLSSLRTFNNKIRELRLRGVASYASSSDVIYTETSPGNTVAHIPEMFARDVAVFIKTSRTLKSIDLSLNLLDDKAIEILDAALKGSKLERVDFSDNKISPLGMQKLLAVATQNSRIVEMPVRGNDWRKQYGCIILGSQYSQVEEQYRDVNQKIALRVEHNFLSSAIPWACVSILMAFYRSNCNNAFRMSILPLIRSFFPLLGWLGRDTPIPDLQKWIDTRFFQAITMPCDNSLSSGRDSVSSTHGIKRKKE